MAQTTDSFAKSEFQLEVSDDGTTWVDISGWATTFEISGGERMNSETHTADGDVPIVTAAKRAAQTGSATIVYTEGAAHAFNTVNALYLSNAGIYVRYSPQGGSTGNKRFFATDAAGSAPTAVSVLSCNPPNMDAGTGDTTTAEFTVMAPQFKEETIA